MITETIKQTIRRYHLIDKGDLVLLAVSGGPDSVAMLYALNSLKQELGFNLHIAHLDHMLRIDSAKDAEYVRELAAGLKIRVTIAKVNVKKLSLKGSKEEIARNARLDFLCKTAKAVRAKKIALAHSLDDQAETVLMRILRGTGLYGLAGILPKRNINGFCFIRPLIEIKRKEIEAYLRKRKLKPRLDSTNLEDIFFRNKIRHKLLPLLEKGYNNNIRELLANMAQNLGADYEYLNRIAGRALNGRAAKINLKKLKRLHPALRRLIYRHAINKLKGDTRRITFQHIKELDDLVLNRPLNSVVDLPKGVSAVKRATSLSFYHKATS